MKVIVIREDNHGLIGLALAYQNAISFLIENNWFGSQTEVMNSNEEWVTVEEFVGLPNGWEEKIREWGLQKFNEVFEGCFYLEEMEVYN